MPSVQLFLEYVMNDGIEDRVVHNQRVKVYERLVRRILLAPHAPAVVLVQVGWRGGGVGGGERSGSGGGMRDEGVYGSWHPMCLP